MIVLIKFTYVKYLVNACTSLNILQCKVKKYFLYMR